jgi:hypothetical protein
MCSRRSNVCGHLGSAGEQKKAQELVLGTNESEQLLQGAADRSYRDRVHRLSPCWKGLRWPANSAFAACVALPSNEISAQRRSASRRLFKDKGAS